MGFSEYRFFIDEKDFQSIFAFETSTDDYNDDLLRNHPIVKKWWNFMTDFMYTKRNNSTISTSLIPIFYVS